jgi:hypothetical protein
LQNHRKTQALFAAVFCGLNLLDFFLPLARSPLLSTPIAYARTPKHRKTSRVIRTAEDRSGTRRSPGRACCPVILTTDFLNGPSDSGVRPFLGSQMFEGNSMT